MRTALTIGLAIVALVAATLWGVAQFGGVRSPPQESQAAEAASDAGAVNAPSPEAPIAPAPAASPVGSEPEEPGAASPDNTLESLELESGAPAESARREVERSVESVFEAARAPREVVEPMSAPAPELRGTAETTAPVAAVPPPPPLSEQFKLRQVTYNRPPKTLTLNHPIDVSLVINATDDASAGADALQGFPGTVVERDVDLSDIVSAQLTGVGFDIQTQSVERQKLSERTVNRWQWRVTPTEPGRRTLILEIFGYQSGGLEAEPLDAYRDEITVEVQEIERLLGLATTYQPVFAVVAGVAGLLSALLALVRFRNERRRQG